MTINSISFFKKKGKIAGSNKTVANDKGESAIGHYFNFIASTLDI
jgi:hypothetical protein